MVYANNERNRKPIFYSNKNKRKNRRLFFQTKQKKSFFSSNTSSKYQFEYGSSLLLTKILLFTTATIIMTIPQFRMAFVLNSQL